MFDMMFRNDDDRSRIRIEWDPQPEERIVGEERFVLEYYTLSR